MKNKNQESFFKKRTIAFLSLGSFVSLIPLIILLSICCILTAFVISTVIREPSPNERDFNNTEWRSESPKIHLTIFNYHLFGQVFLEDKVYDIHGQMWALNGIIEFWYEILDDNEKHMRRITFMFADYEYEDGKIKIDDIEFENIDWNDREAIKDVLKDVKKITFSKERDIDSSLVQEWKCVEMNMNFFTYGETDVYAYGSIPQSPFCFEDVEHDPIKIRKSYDNYYHIDISNGRKSYVSPIILDKKENEIVFTILDPLNISEDHQQYFPENLTQLTFRKKASE